MTYARLILQDVIAEFSQQMTLVLHMFFLLTHMFCCGFFST